MGKIRDIKLPNNETYDIYGKNVENIKWSDYEDLSEQQKKSDIAYFITDVPSDELDNGLIGSASGSCASFTDGSDMPLKSLTATIEAVQEGSGDPSPTNVRPISGWTGCEVTVADDTTTPTVEQTYTIPFTDSQGNPVEVYGGSVDVVNGGEQPRTLGSVDMGDLNWTRHEDSGSFYVAIGNMKHGGELLSSIYPFYTNTYTYSQVPSYPDGIIGTNTSNQRVYVKDTRYTDASDFKTAMNGVQLVYELATPTTFYTQPTAVKSLEGENVIFADTGDIQKVEYYKSRPVQLRMNDQVISGGNTVGYAMMAKYAEHSNDAPKFKVTNGVLEVII